MSKTLPTKAQLADHLLGGGLAQLIERARAAETSYEHIARLIWAETQGRVSVTGVTVQAWHDRLLADPETAA